MKMSVITEGLYAMVAPHLDGPNQSVGPGASTLEIDEMLTKTWCQELMFWVLAVEHIGRGTTYRAAEHSGKRVDGQRIGFLGFQRSSGRYE